MKRNDKKTILIIAGYEVFRFGVPMIGEYVNARSHQYKQGKVLISPVVQGAHYRITAWALDSSTRRSAKPAVKSVTTGGASE